MKYLVLVDVVCILEDVLVSLVENSVDEKEMQREQGNDEWSTEIMHMVKLLEEYHIDDRFKGVRN